MPNHFHRIIENKGGGWLLDNGCLLDKDLQSDNGWQLVVVGNLGAHIGAPLRGHPTMDERGCPTIDENGLSTINKNGHAMILNDADNTLTLF